MTFSQHSRDDAVAIIGMSFAFPGANDRETFWANLLDARESLTHVDRARLLAAGVPVATVDDPDYVPVAPLMDGADMFDAAFFGYSPREAQVRDPQSRLFLQHCWAALEDAGHAPRSPGGHVGVFGGMSNNLYGEHHVSRNARVLRSVGGMTVEVSNSPDYLCSNVSHRLGLNGPSLTVQAACATSLVAVHLATQSLRAGECDLALAGGVEVDLPLGAGYMWEEGGIYSRSGHVRPFSADADGTVFGDGVGVVVLRRLEDALRDGDPVHAVVLGSATNNDGADRAGFTAPGARGQAALLLEALSDAGVSTRDVQYLEAHATGTLVGDPIEVSGLKHAFATAGDDRRGAVPIGSVKGNVGHLGPAAGMAGLVKVCLAMQHGVIPPTVGVGSPNPRLGLEDSPFHVPQVPVAWPAGPRVAGVSSFGIGGTNAHVVLGEPPRPTARPATDAARPLVVSARTAAALAEARDRLADRLDDPTVDLDAAAWTLQDGRTPMAHRLAVVADRAGAAAALRAAGTAAAQVQPNPRVVLALPGQGAQFPGMLRELVEDSPSAADALEQVRALVLAEGGADIGPVLLDPTSDPQDLQRTAVTQPAVFAASLATAAALRSWGVVPDALLGHSLGEVTAAHLSGALGLEDTVRLLCARARLLEACPPGAMLAVGAPWSEVGPLLAGTVEPAAHNGRRTVTVAGSAEAVDEAVRLLERLGVWTARLRTSRAFHSALVAGAADELAEVAAGLRWQEPTVPCVTGLTGEWVEAATFADPGHWARQLREPVQFERATATVLDGSAAVVVECGPGQTLTDLVAGAPGVRTVVTASRGLRGAATAQAALWTAGVTVDWRATWDEVPRRTPLPTYPFERVRHWTDPDPAPVGRDAQQDDAPEGPHPLEDGALGVGLWQETPPAPPATPTAPVLLVGTDRSRVAPLADALAVHGVPVVVLCAGERDLTAEPMPGAPARWTADVDDRDDLVQALDELVLRTGADRLQVVHVVTPPADDRPTADMATDATALFDTLLATAQAVAARPGTATELVVVTAGLYDVGAGAPTDPAQAVALGPVLLLARESTHADARVVDLAPGAGPLGDADAAVLVRELGRAGAEVRVALRGRRRYALAYAPYGLPPAVEDVRHDGDGAVVVTGAFGGIGLEVAEDVVRRGARRLVLVSRSGLPPRDGWAALADAPAPQGRAVRRVLDLERLGAEVTVVACDVADAAQVGELAATLRATGTPVRALYHCAGVAGGGMLAGRTRAAAHAVLAPKVAGTVHLYRELGRDLDLLVLFSSVTGVSGTFGMVDYCAANSFLDAFAAWADADGTSAVSIGWTGWSQVGMAEDMRDAAPAAYRALQASALPRSVHPLVDEVLAAGALAVTTRTVLRPGQHWVAAEHRVGGRDVVVGTALVEMVVAAHAQTGERAVRLADVTLLSAVAVEGEVVLQVRLERDDAAAPWQATVEWSTTGNAGPWSVAAVATVEAADPPTGRVDLDALIAAHPGTVPAEKLAAPHRLIAMGDRWRSIVATHHGPTSEVVRVELPAHVRGDVDRFVLHPAVLDNAIGDGQHGLSAPPGSSYLPLSYATLAWSRPLPPAVWSYIRHRDGRDGDITVADITLLDDDGVVVAQVGGFAMRRLRHDAFSARLGAATPADSPTGAGGDGADADSWTSIDPATGIEALRRILAWRPAPHVLVTPEGITSVIRHSEQFDLGLVEDRLLDAPLAAAGHDTGADEDDGVPLTPREAELAALWSEVLGVRGVRPGDDFFALGGNSLVAVQLVARIRTIHGLRVSVATLFDHSTLAGFAEALGTRGAEPAAAVTA